MNDPAWIGAGVEGVAFQQEAVKERFAQVTRKDASGQPRIVCRGQMVGVPSVSLFLRVPPELIQRLKHLTEGNHTVAAWALLEDALCAIESGRQSVVVTMADRSND